MKKYLFGGGIILMSILGIALLVSAPKVEAVHPLSGAEFVALATKTPSAILLDVRTPAEFVAGHIAGAQNIDIENSTFLSKIQKLDKEKSYFVYCRSGNRSHQATTMMHQNGFTHVYDLTGGIVGNTSTVDLVSTSRDALYEVDPSDLLPTTTPSTEKSKTTLTKAETDGLIQMREEEKLARDVYRTLGGVWGAQVFTNIAASEQTHTDAIKGLLLRYGVTDPVTDDTIGVFHSENMQKLYAELVAKGKVSYEKALIVGATIEDLDLYDLDVLKKETSKEDIIAVYTKLEKGSRNHMRGCVRNLSASGMEYTPSYISTEVYAGIIAGAQERGRN